MAEEDTGDQGSKQDAVAGANMNDIASVDNENSTLSEALVDHIEGRITKGAYKAVQNMVKISKNISKVREEKRGDEEHHAVCAVCCVLCAVCCVLCGTAC